MSDSLTGLFREAVRQVIRGDLSRHLGWNLLLADQLPPAKRVAAILTEFDIAAVMSLNGSKVTGYFGVGFKEGLAVNVALSLDGQLNTGAPDIYAPPDPLIYGKDPYADMYLMVESQINEQVEDAVRQTAAFAAQSLAACLRKSGLALEIGLPMVVVGKGMTSFASFPLSAVTTPFFIEDGCGCLEFAIAAPDENPYGG